MNKHSDSARLLLRIKNHSGLYVMLIPVAVYLIIFWLIPLYGIQIAFRDFKVSDGFFGSRWVGLQYFLRYFNSFYFERTIRNTIGINLYGLLTGFPLSIILSLMFNEIRKDRFKNFAQIVSYAPAFLSAVVVSGMILAFLSPSTGFVNAIMKALGLSAVDFMSKTEYFWSIYIWSNIWQGLGFSTIVYVAAMSSISEELYEAATLDGAGRLQKMWHITLTGIRYVIVIMLLLNLGNMLTLGFEKVYLLQNNLNLEASEVISTYVYKAGLISGQYSYSTAISLFNTVINLVLLGGANTVSKKLFEISLW